MSAGRKRGGDGALSLGGNGVEIGCGDYVVSGGGDGVESGGGSGVENKCMNARHAETCFLKIILR